LWSGLVAGPFHCVSEGPHGGSRPPEADGGPPTGPIRPTPGCGAGWGPTERCSAPPCGPSTGCRAIMRRPCRPSPGEPGSRRDSCALALNACCQTADTPLEAPRFIATTEQAPPPRSARKLGRSRPSRRAREPASTEASGQPLHGGDVCGCAFMTAQARRRRPVLLIDRRSRRSRRRIGRHPPAGVAGLRTLPLGWRPV